MSVSPTYISVWRPLRFVIFPLPKSPPQPLAPHGRKPTPSHVSAGGSPHSHTPQPPPRLLLTTRHTLLPAPEILSVLTSLDMDCRSTLHGGQLQKLRPSVDRRMVDPVPPPGHTGAAGRKRVRASRPPITGGGGSSGPGAHVALPARGNGPEAAEPAPLPRQAGATPQPGVPVGRRWTPTCKPRPPRRSERKRRPEPEIRDVTLRGHGASDPPSRQHSIRPEARP